MLKLVHDATASAVGENEPTTIGLDELCQMAAQEMLAVALLAERRAYLEAHASELDATGKRLVVGNGYARSREVTTGAGMVEVSAPRVDDRREGEHFSSAILPAYMRKSPKVTEVLPILYLRGLSTGDFAPALGEFFDAEAGLSASSINRLTVAFQAEHAEWSERDLSGVDYVYFWVDGVHFNIRLEEDRLCCLVIVGVRPDGTKELVALADGYRESTESWADVLRSLKDRGLSAPVLAVGDGALGHLLIGLGMAACEQGRSVRYVTCAGLVNELAEAADERRLSRLVARYGRLDLLCLDELGYVQLDAKGAELLFQILTEREEKSSVATASNLPFSEWGQVVGDPAAGGRHRRPAHLQRPHHRDRHRKLPLEFDQGQAGEVSRRLSGSAAGRR